MLKKFESRSFLTIAAMAFAMLALGGMALVTLVKFLQMGQ